MPGGFGTRGIEGKIAAAKWARENKKPYLGICLGESFESLNNLCMRQNLTTNKHSLETNGSFL